MTQTEKIRSKLEVLGDEATPNQLVHVLYEILDLIDGKKTIGFKHEKEK